VGIALWVVSGFGAAAVARLVPLGKSERWVAEGLIGVSTSLILGLMATALDFGGWNEVDWRTSLFSGFGAFAAIGAFRAARLSGSKIV
jgi:hypothetical protein